MTLQQERKLSINDELSDVTADFVSNLEAPLLRLFKYQPGMWIDAESLVEDDLAFLSRIRHVQSRCRGTLEIMWGYFEDDPAFVTIVFYVAERFWHTLAVYNKALLLNKYAQMDSSPEE
jgi:hypothetical protein